MKKIFLSLIAVSIAGILNAQIYLAKECVIKFFAGTALEDIDATNNVAKPILDISKGDIAVKIVIKNFKFTNSLMEEHFNENYLESDKYPDAKFTGKINEKIDYTIDGVTKVTVTGKLKVHNVEKDRTLDGTVTVKGTQIIIDTKFKIKLADHNIKIPSAVGAKIAEEVEVTLNSTLEPFKKK